MSDGVFRSKKGFTVVQNSVTKDNSISLRAKGLYVLMQTYITMPDRKYKKSEFMKMVPEGKCTFEAAWKELKAAGFIKQHVFCMGHAFRTEYELLDEPQKGINMYYYDREGTLTKTSE